MPQRIPRKPVPSQRQEQGQQQQQQQQEQQQPQSQPLLQPQPQSHPPSQPQPPQSQSQPQPQQPQQHEKPVLPKGWEKQFTAKFRQALSTKRMEVLIRRNSSSAARRARSPSAPASGRPISRHSSSASLHPSQSQQQQLRPQLLRAGQSLLPPRHGTGMRTTSPDEPSLDDFSYGDDDGAGSSGGIIANIPLIPTPATELAHLQFRNQLVLLSETPLKWENPGLLDEAMKSIPLERIYERAEEERAALQAAAARAGQKPRWEYQDCVIRQLLKWFKRDFFTWVNNPPCSRCGSPTVAKGMVAPNDMERGLGGQRVELYQCHAAACGWYERFPRYNDAFVLLQTRRGRCGEWANCFTMLCRAMGSRVRWVWNSEDHVWTEVYSEYRKRWIHVDACEEAFDKPTIYATGWNKKLGYCIAFGAEGAMDVTGRYCRNPHLYGKPRTRCPEAVLHYIMDELRHMRRRDMSKTERFKLEGEDAFEMKELRHYYISAFVEELCSLVPGGGGAGGRGRRDPDAEKAAEGRQTGTAEWTRARGEDGRTGPDNIQRPPR